MRHRFIRSAVLAGGLSVAVAAIFASDAGAAPAAPGLSSVVRAAGVTPAASRPARTALLINGDKITVAGAAAGGQAGAVTPAGSALASTLVSLMVGGTSYVVPADALPYLGRGLDPSLFNVTRLLSAERNGRLPLRVSYHGRLPVIAGLRLTRHGGGTADGYLAASSAKAFGAALARQYLAGRGHGGHRADGMFGHGLSISLAGSGPARTVRPRFVMHTITVTGTDLANRPDTGDVVFLVNVDDSSITTYPDPVASVFYHGAAKFSLPAGHYFALADFLQLSARGALTAERIVTLPQFTVSGDAIVHMRERAASSKVTIVTPRPAVTEATELQMTRVPRIGRPMTFGFFDAAPVATWVSPVARRVTVGSLRAFLDAWRASPAWAARPYEYDLAFQGPPGVIPAEHYVVRRASLATVRARYFSPVPRRASLGRGGYSEFQFEHALPPDIQSVHHLAPATPLRLPQVRTEYTTASPSLAWGSTLFFPGGQSNGALIQYDTLHVYHRGGRASEDWNGGPLHPGADVSLASASFSNITWPVPSASRAGDVLTLIITPFSDSTPGHLGFGYGAFPPGTAVRGTYEIDQDGTRIAGGDATVGGAGPFIAQVPLSPAGSTVTFRLSASRTGAAYPLSTRTQTTWTWRSAHQPGGSLPAGWICPAEDQDHCAVEPMMTLGYHVAGLALDDTARPGPQILGVTVGHLQLARAARITSTRVQVSFDDGATWHAAAVTGASGRYQASYRVPTTARYVTLRVTAADAAGGRITETITRAYKIAS
jgi:hypothetical protein